MTIRKPDGPAFGCLLYSQVLISGRIRLSNCLFSLELDFDIRTINLSLNIQIFGSDIKVYRIGGPYRVAQVE
jgi:hypothetical protein